MTCRFCGEPAVAVFRLPGGCVCFPDDREQALCPQHILRATPLAGMELMITLKTILCTKYCLTDGITEHELIEIRDHGEATVKDLGGSNWMIHLRPNEWVHTKEAATERFEQMLAARIKSLEKQISKLQAMAHNGPTFVPTQEE